jgi:acetylglutamate kinase
MLTATRIASLGYAGSPAAVKADLIQTLLGAGYLPVISPLASEEGGEVGEALNVNGDDAAAAIAIAMNASELLVRCGCRWRARRGRGADDAS